MTEPTPELQFRVYVDGELVVDERLGPDDDIEAAMERHVDVVERAGDKIWMVEISDPDGLIAPLRMSNDPEKLVVPLKMGPDAIDYILRQRDPLSQEPPPLS